jgi:ribokinase
MKKILVIGSLNMDITLRMERAPEAGETLTADSMVASPGGKGANQAYAAGKLGGDVAMLGAVGQDAYGEELIANLASVGVDVSGIQKIADVPTGTAVIYVEHTGENRIVLVTGANGRVDRAYIDAHMDKIASCDIVILQLEIPLDTVVYAAKKAKGLGKTVIVDPAPAVPDIPKELWAYVDYIKPNETELNIILTGKADGLPLDEALTQVQQLGVKNVWVTMGGHGVFFRDENGREETIPSVRVKAVDTTAAGDTFLAAAAVSLSKGKTPAEAIAYGNRAAALAVTRPGAQQSVPTEEEVEGFIG